MVSQVQALLVGKVQMALQGGEAIFCCGLATHIRNDVSESEIRTPSIIIKWVDGIDFE